MIIIIIIIIINIIVVIIIIIIIIKIKISSAAVVTCALRVNVPFLKCFNFQIYQAWHYLYIINVVYVEVLQPSQPMGSCRARSVYLITHLLGRPSPPSG